MTISGSFYCSNNMGACAEMNLHRERKTKQIKEHFLEQKQAEVNEDPPQLPQGKQTGKLFLKKCICSFLCHLNLVYVQV